MLAIVLATVSVDHPIVPIVLAALCAVSVLAWAILRTRVQRGRYEEELALWAAERARQNERLRIAAELHDLVSHGLGLITVRAAVACTVPHAGGDAERSAALADIEDVSRATTTELRRMLGVLRDPRAAPLRPADTVADLPAIVAAANSAGVRATLAVDDVSDQPAGVQLTVCAVVREALNNALRHAGPTTASVVVHRQRDEIVVEVHDSGPVDGWRPQRGAGHGLDGLRQRITLVGGQLHTRANPAGFHIVARIPHVSQP